jgi:hypothetical protein
MKRGVLVDGLVLRNEWSHIDCSGSVEVDAFSQFFFDQRFQPAMIVGSDLIVLVHLDDDMFGGQNIDIAIYITKS